ncbi:DUF3077 family protein [Pseudomonas sp. SJZ103]|jgi:hypothetical protein|uniref:DUF3077 domain-containing protein n=1 Tax=unclassified Pseudomonas TaxID=196821 RepID=UPI0011AA338C|nr:MULTISPECIES: DUF3077 domain-containing protein [unclassified Pseudomonas]TWC74370.1 DUF3077 family protein [Pseudomonas sp. SJZ103]TWC93501.1 DUF3077 family protein [Pseudomonas sp. SJZ094]
MTSPAEHKTPGHTQFTKVNKEGRMLFRVNAGISIDEALEVASHLQFFANQFAFDAAMTDNCERLSWASYYLGEMAKALIDDVTDGLFLARPDQ